MNEGEPLLLANEGPVARITFNRPEAGNTVNLEAARHLLHIVQSLRGSGTRAVVLTGNGSVFCGGGDVRSMSEAEDVTTYLTELADTFHAALTELSTLDAVVIAAVDGAVAGGGLGLVLHADIILASEHARFLTGYEGLGVTPDSGVSWLLPRTIGLHRALQLSLTSRVLDADTALDWGLVSKVIPSESLLESASSLAAHLARNPVDHLVETRRMYRHTVTDGLERLAEESAGIAAAAGSEYGIQQIQRFARNRDERN